MGFVPGMGTGVNIMEVVKILRETKKRDKIAAIFFDLSSAYNSVERKKLYEIMTRKGILERKEILFLKCLHSIIHFK